MNEFLQKYALNYEISGEGKTFIFIDTNINKIIGYYTLKANSMRVENLNGYSVHPAIEISRFAIDKKYQGKFVLGGNIKYSKLLMKDAIFSITKLKKKFIGVRFMILFALPDDKVVRFYKNNKLHETYNENAFLIDNDNKGLIPMYSII